MLHIHPEDGRYDYALIELADPIEMRPEARAAFLPDGSEPFQSVCTEVYSKWMGVLESYQSSKIEGVEKCDNTLGA